MVPNPSQGIHYLFPYMKVLSENGPLCSLFNLKGYLKNPFSREPL